jgi:hypothetical protein
MTYPNLDLAQQRHNPLRTEMLFRHIQAPFQAALRA